MVHGYHVIWGTYGFWLPNDPRGSWSDFVWSWELVRYGVATRSHKRVDVVPQEYAAWRQAALSSLRYPEVSLTDVQIAQVGLAFQQFVEHSGVTVWACSILEQHVHMVLARHRYAVEQLANLLKGRAQSALIDAGLHPLGQYRTRQDRIPSMWADKRWAVFLDSEEAIDQAIRYVEENPIREGKARQVWPFVQAFQGLDLRGGWTTYR